MYQAMYLYYSIGTYIFVKMIKHFNIFHSIENNEAYVIKHFTSFFNIYVVMDVKFLLFVKRLLTN